MRGAVVGASVFSRTRQVLKQWQSVYVLAGALLLPLTAVPQHARAGIIYEEHFNDDFPAEMDLDCSSMSEDWYCLDVDAYGCTSPLAEYWWSDEDRVDDDASTFQYGSAQILLHSACGDQPLRPLLTRDLDPDDAQVGSVYPDGVYNLTAGDVVVFSAWVRAENARSEPTLRIWWRKDDGGYNDDLYYTTGGGVTTGFVGRPLPPGDGLGVPVWTRIALAARVPAEDLAAGIPEDATGASFQFSTEAYWDELSGSEPAKFWIDDVTVSTWSVPVHPRPRRPAPHR